MEGHSHCVTNGIGIFIEFVSFFLYFCFACCVLWNFRYQEEESAIPPEEAADEARCAGLTKGPDIEVADEEFTVIVNGCSAIKLCE